MWGAEESGRPKTAGYRVMGHTLFEDLVIGPKILNFVVLLNYIMFGIGAYVF